MRGAEALADPLVLWVVPVAELGGVGRHVLDALGHGLPGLRTVLLCPEGPLAQRARRAGIAVLTDELGPQAGLAISVRSLRRAVRRLRPRAVHTHLAYADLMGALALAGDRSTTLISTEHGIAPDQRLYQSSRPRAAAARAGHRARLRRVDHLIAVSRSTRDVVRRVWDPGCPISVVPNGVDGQRVRAAAGAGPRRGLGHGLRILALSRLAPEKNIGALIRAMPAILERDPQARLTIAGEGPLRAALERLSTSTGLGSEVAFVGQVDPWPAMAAHDVLVQLSAWENLSYSLLDAAAAGMPALATEVGGNAEILRPEALIAQPCTPDILAGLERVTRREIGTRPVSDLETMTHRIARIVKGALR
ncbi:glycosyltransferase [Kocuria palustris]|uniref:glycosyltransferase n=1 Tax=Kocuria palustris TaxID=71999 RepID=UPI00164342CC|nr:glycosyltransferase [Kocuria palustris]